MDYDNFIAKVAERAGTPRGEAEALARATLQTLAERITGGEAQDLAAQLPKQAGAAFPRSDSDDRHVRRLGLDGSQHGGLIRAR